MLENLRKMEPLSPEEENRIITRLRLGVILAAVAVLAYVIWSVVNKRGLSAAYYVLVVVLLLTNWGLSDIAPIFLCRSLAGRSRRQVSAYMKTVLFGLVANIGLGWFLIALQNQSIYGAVLYLIGVMFARKQREIYNSTDEEDEEPETVIPVKAQPEHLPTAADRLKRLNEISAQLEEAEEAEETVDTEDAVETAEAGEMSVDTGETAEALETAEAVETAAEAVETAEFGEEAQAAEEAEAAPAVEAGDAEERDGSV